MRAAITTVIALTSPLIAQPVELIDWLGVGGISDNDETLFTVVRSASLPLEATVIESYAQTPVSPEGSINATYELVSTPDGFVFTCDYFGRVSGASPDGSTDGPIVMLAVLFRVHEPTTYEIVSEASIGVGEGLPGNTPIVTAIVDPEFCFVPGVEPQANSRLCSINNLPELVTRFHFASDGTSTSLDECCPVSPDIGETSGLLQPGDYTIALQSLTGLNVAQGGGGSGNGYLKIQLGSGEVCTPDLNGDGIVDQGDIGSFIDLFLVQDLAVDFNGDGIIDTGDISTFVAAFLSGC